MVSALKIVANKAVDDLNFYFKLFLKPGKVKDSLKQCLEEENMSESNKELHKTGGFDNIPYIEDFTSFVVNLLLYLTSKEPDILKQLPVNFDSVIKNVKNRAKLRKIDKIRERSTEKTIMVVGSHLPKNTDEFNQIKDSGGIGGWKLKNKVKVSAHWRTQWYGSTKDGTRRSETIRVQEYDKGPDAAEYITKKRVVV